MKNNKETNESIVCSNCVHLNPPRTEHCTYCGSGLKSVNTKSIPHIPSKVIAAILAWFFGVFGIHRFYIGKTWSGFFQLLIGGTGLVLTIAALSWFSVLLLIIASIWVIIDFITIICGAMLDTKGRYVK